ncbi:unnamed protein product [Gulo gulo]|uniref:Uncharacterized protein n=1 Tax=Gulo gulo TaxID=48420 RepID=A0A9X9LZW9_GULGU|nr:unnamed protein product [Gulo gulo]
MAVVTDSTGERFRVEIAILASFSALVTCEVTISGTPGETVGVGTTELTSAPWLVATKGVVYDSLWETLGIVLGTVGMVSAGWVINETAVSGPPGEIVRVGAAELTSFSEWNW